MKNIITIIFTISLAFAVEARSVPVYAPKTSGTSGQILKSGGPNASPAWINDTNTCVILNGTSKKGSAADFYAPTDSGTSGQVLVSNGENAAPTWGLPPIKWQRATKASYASGNVDCYRQGNVVCLRVDSFNIGTGAASGCVTIPSGYKPNTWVLSPLMTTSCGVGGLNINPSTGAAQLFGSQSTSYYGTIMFFTNDAMP